MRKKFELEKKINSRVKIRDQNEKEYYLREQMKAIQKELGEKEGRMGEVEELRQKLSELKAPEEIKEKIDKEIDRLKNPDQFR